MILSDRDIREEINRGRLKIDPISEDTIRENGIDLRIGNSIGVFMHPIDMKKPVDVTIINEDKHIINANEHVLLHTVEKLSLPDNIVGMVNLRSSYARSGLIIPPTVVDAGFEGDLTIELVGGQVPVTIYPGSRFIHLVLMYTHTPVEKPYKGKYKGQNGVTPTRLNGEYNE